MQRRAVQSNQQGFVSIIVAMVLIAIITLVTLGFAYLARQNQRNAMNRQLSSQAFYAAESGVNDAVRNLASLSSTNDCANTSQVGNGVINESTKVQYTCVLVNTQPTSLIYDSVSDKASTVAHITTSVPVANIKVSWSDPGGSQVFAPNSTASSFPLPNQPTFSSSVCPAGCDIATASFPNNIGILRTTIIPSSAATSTDSLLNGSQTIFMYPAAHTASSSGTSVAFRSGGALTTEGIFASGRCFSTNTPRSCNVIVTGINSSDFYIRMRSLYKPVSVTIQAYQNSDNSGLLPISGAQVMIDSTGKAQDVVRRIQVRVPLNPGYYFPEYAIETGNTICKRMSVFPGGAQVISPPGSLGSNNDGDLDEKACQIPGQAQPTFPY